MQIRNNPQHYLLFTGLALLVATLFMNSTNTIVIHIDDTYYVIAIQHVWVMMAILVWVLWILYLPFRNILYSGRLSSVHIVTSIIAVVCLLVLVSYGDILFQSQARRYMDFDYWSFKYGNSQARWMFMAIAILLLSQVIFIVNLFAGLLKWRRNA